MAKRVPKKKVTRRLKRSVRKSLAAVLMITAIVVAAIPVPEMAASNGAARKMSDSVRNEQPTYTVTAADDIDVAELKRLHELDDAKDGTGYRLIKIGDSWQLHWMFRYYQDTQFGNDNTIVTKYNNNYPQDSIDMGTSVYSKYVTVEPDTYEDWYENTLKVSNTKWTLTGKEGPNLTQIKRYFLSEYADYIKRWDEWNALPDDKKGPEPVLEVSEASIAGSDPKSKQYYCETVNPKDAAYRLYPCEIPVKQTNGQTTLETVHIPRLIKHIAEETGESLIEVPDPTEAKYDVDGFLAETKLTAVVAIAPKAFEGVVNLKEVILPPVTKYIGDEAFRKATSMTQLSGEGIEAIGNRAFQECTSISNLNIMSALRQIGAEAFKGSGVSEITLAHSLEEIGAGAFADCARLSTIVVEDAARSYFKVGNYAFFNCPSIQNFDWNTAHDTVTEIGDGAFAFSSTTDGAMDTFYFPSGTASTAKIKLGDYIFANRTGLKKVTMPKVEIEQLNSQTSNTVPQFTFLNCYNLDWVEFPAASNSMAMANLKFEKDLFNEVVNEKFYVKGPKYRKGDTKSPADCRKSTWYAECIGLTAIPYMFIDNDGKEYYELCQDGKLLLVDESGALTSCTFEPIDPDTGHQDGEVVIPAYAGDRLITSLASGSFDQKDLEGHVMKNYITAITFDKDCAIKTIEDGVFKDCPKLKTVVLSGSVSKIGSEAFANCGTEDPSKVFDVTFDTPNAYNATGNVELGRDAFTTGGSPVIFRGIAEGGYGPYEHAINADTYANKAKNLRICYRSIAPQNLTVIVDNATNEPTLVGYPFYENVDKDNKAFCHEMEDYFTRYYADSKFDYYRDNPDTADKGPWMPDNDNNGISDYYDNHRYSLEEIYENIQNGSTAEYSNEPFMQMTLEGKAILDAVFHVRVPEGVTSIDTTAYFSNPTDNGYNIAEYLKEEKAKYYDEKGAPDKDVIPGLFSGYFEEPKFSGEKVIRGNDYIQSIELTSVKRLPDYAFDSCENLKSVSIGKACDDIGQTPFRDCPLISEFGGNDKFTTDGNGIIYSVNDSGHKTIETCMPTRGTKVNGQVFGSTTVSVETDPTLKDVNYIKPGAFESCKGIRYVDLMGAKLITEITPQAFKECSIMQVTLPDNITDIKEEAFANNIGITAIIYGREVSIRNSAFPHGDEMTLMRSLDDSAAHRYADTYKIPFKALDDNSWAVKFMDYDGTYFGETQYIENDKPAAVPNDPVRVGYIFTGWNPTVTGMSTQKITADVTFVAQYKSDPKYDNNGNGDKPPTNPDGTPEKPGDEENKNKIFTVTVINGSGSGSYQEGKEVSITANAPSTGRKFDRWESNSLNVAIADVKAKTTTFKMPGNNVVVTAVYDGGNGSASSDKENGNSSGSSGGNAGTGNTNSSGSSGAGSGNGGNGATGMGGTTTGQNGTLVTIPNGIGISNTGAASATVDGATDNFVVKITSDPYATEAVERALTNEYGTLDNIRYYPMDISLYDSTGTTRIADTTGLSVNITMPIPDDLLPYAGNNKAGAVVNGDTLEKLGATFKTIDGIPCINFTAKHFSPYTIYVDTQNLTAAIDESPKTGDPIHPKWFLALGLACLSVVLFMKKDKASTRLA